MKDKKSVRDSCVKCDTNHTKNEHRFHGMGSYKNTHVGYCTFKCCGSQEDSKCYNPETRRKEMIRKRNNAPSDKLINSRTGHVISTNGKRIISSSRFRGND